jgi:FixJ family two-component response regulator
MPLQSDQKTIVHVVDDDPLIREALQDLFSPASFTLKRR